VFILDTDVVSNLRKKKPHPNLVSWIDGIAGRTWQPLYDPFHSKWLIEPPDSASTR
jgi:predicted nucleic acid-binding protein